jgi:hypothetical protein
LYSFVIDKNEKYPILEKYNSMKNKLCTILLIFFFSSTSLFAAMKNNELPTSPYTGKENREIKTLSDEKVQALLEGSGIGYALSAELNQYPGPKHVLELQNQLDLTKQQLAATQYLFNKMKEKAKQLGKKLINQEQLLEEQFRLGRITPNQIQDKVSDISKTQASLRSTHLIAHIKQREILTLNQQVQYQQLRGYDQNKSNHNSHNKKHIH